MAFDRTNPAHLTAARDYITVTKGLPVTTDTPVILDHFNDPSLNPTPANGANPLTARRLVDAVWESTVASQDQFKVQLLVEATTSIDDDVSDWRLRAIALGTQLGNAISAQTRALSWAEVTFGAADANGVYESVVITRDDWFAARDSV